MAATGVDIACPDPIALRNRHVRQRCRDGCRPRHGHCVSSTPTRHPNANALSTAVNDGPHPKPYRRPFLSKPSTTTVIAFSAKERSLFEVKENPKEVTRRERAEDLLEGQVVYVRLNKRIISAVASTMEIVEVYGRRDPRSEEAALQLIEDYGKLMKEETLNIVNCVTMIHRVGLIFGAVNRTSTLFDRCQDVLIDLIHLLSSFYHKFDARQLSNVVWALGNIGRSLFVLPYNGISFPRLYSDLLRRVMEITDYRPPEIASCMTGMAKMQLKAQTCRLALDHLTYLAVMSMNEFRPKAMAGLFWALGSFPYRPKNGFIRSAVQRMSQTLDDFEPREMSNVIWGFAHLDARASLVHLLPLMEKHFLREIWNYTEQGMSLVLWSFAKLRYLPQKGTMDKAMKYLKFRLNNLSPQSMSHVVYACAIFGYSLPPDILDRLQISFLERSQDFTLQLRCLFVWSLAILFSLELSLFQSVVRDMEKGDWKGELSESEKRQLYQCMIHVQFFVPGGNRAMHQVPKELLADCQMAWEHGQYSKWRDAVCLAVLVQLQGMGYTPFSQLLTSKGLARYSVDVVRRADRIEHIAIEISIAKHCFANNKNMIEGPRLWAMKLLKRNGFKVLQIHAEIWKTSSIEERRAYLTQLLNEKEK